MLLELEELAKDFGGLVAVDDVSMGLSDEEIISVIGPNGAGKTTLFNLITGLYQPSSGSIRFKGEVITGLSPRQRVNRGISRSFQINNLYTDRTVRQNVRLPLINKYDYLTDFWSKVDDIPEIEEDVHKILEYVGLDINPDTVAKNMSYGEKRQLEIAIAIATDPELLLLDEPTAGIDTEKASGIIDTIKKLNESYPILLVEHNIDLVLDISDRIVVLASGRKVAEGTPDDIVQNDDVQEIYLGGASA